jgi:hypothetical protein
MNMTKLLGLALLAGLTLSAVGCGKASATGSTGGVNTGKTNDGEDINTGVVVVGPGEQQPPGTTGMRDANGKCINDTDKDGLCNEEDPDIDNDGTPNEKDNDTDGDGIINTLDPDIDDDGVQNEDDADMDGDGKQNEVDDDTDGDGVPDAVDNDTDNDGIPNGEDNDINGNGIPNAQDPDMDGDGKNNDVDDDTDGDNIPNAQDPDPNGTGTVTNPGAGPGVTGEGVSVPFSDDGLVSIITNSIAKTGTGTHYLDFKDVRDSAEDKNAEVGTITVTSIDITVDAASASAFIGHENSKIKMDISYQQAGGPKLLVGTTSTAFPVTVQQVIAGLSMANGTIQKDPNNYSAFQTLMANNSVPGVTVIIDVTLISGTLPDATINMKYDIKASGKVKV